MQADRLNLPSSGGKQPSTDFPGRVRDVVTMRSGPPFILSHDISRGTIHTAQALLHFALMLVVMYVALSPSRRCLCAHIPVRTFQVGFILAIVVGLGVGEALFGRFSSHAAHH